MKIITKNFSLTQKEVDIVKDAADLRNLRSDSAALRQIINEWDQLSKHFAALSLVPTTTITP